MNNYFAKIVEIDLDSLNVLNSPKFPIKHCNFIIFLYFCTKLEFLHIKIMKKELLANILL